MKIDYKGTGEVYGDVKIENMGLDTSNPQKLFYILSKGFYSNKYRAIIQELCSNMYDAYIEAGKDIMEDPAYIVLKDNMIVFQDYGIGISQYRMDNIMSKFMGSTRNNRSDVLGHFGLGSKTPFAYTSQYTVRSTYNGVERTWLFVEDTTGNSYSLLSETESNERNQTAIIIPINEISDLSNWIFFIGKTIPFFKGIVVDNQINSSYYSGLLKRTIEELNTPIYEGENFFFKEKTITSSIVLGQVLYDIKYSDFDIVCSTFFPFVLKFKTDEGLIPTPNREGIIINDNSKQIVKNKMLAVIDELEKYKEANVLLLDSYSEIVNFKFGNKDTYIPRFHLNEVYNWAGKLINTVHPDVQEVRKKVSQHKLFSVLFPETYRIQTNVVKRYIGLPDYYITCKLTSDIKKALRETYNHKVVSVISDSPIKEFAKSYSNPQLVSARLIEERDIFLAKTEDITGFCKNVAKTKKKKEPHNVKFEELYVYQNSFLKKDKFNITIDQFSKSRIYVYDVVNDFPKVNMLQKLDHVKPINIHPVELRKIEHLPNVMSFSDFTTTKYFQRILLKDLKAIWAQEARNIMSDRYFAHSTYWKNVIQDLKVESRPNYYSGLSRYDCLLDNRYLAIKQYYEDIVKKTEHLKPQATDAQMILINYNLRKNKK